MSKKQQAAADEAPRFEAIVDELEALVGRLEGGELPLEEALALYERGVGLARQGGGLLDGAEKKVEALRRTLAEPSP